MRTVLRHQISRKPFVTVANEVARDDRLSFAARGVLLDMLSRPTNWVFSAERIAAGSPREGREAVLRCMKELEIAGYLFRHRERDRITGRMRVVNIVSDEPIDDWENRQSPESGLPTSATRRPGSRTPVNPTPKETQWKKPREETQIQTHSSIPLAGQDQEVRNPDSAGAGSAGADRDLALAMDGWNRDRRRRKPWAELQQAYDEGRIDDTDVTAKLTELLDGLDPAEESTALGMLANGSHPKAIYNKIRADRRSP